MLASRLDLAVCLGIPCQHHVRREQPRTVDSFGIPDRDPEPVRRGIALSELIEKHGIVVLIHREHIHAVLLIQPFNLLPEEGPGVPILA